MKERELQEIEEARHALATSINVLLKQRGSERLRPPNPSQEIAIHMSAKDLNMEDAPGLFNFINNVYANKNIVLRYIIAGNKYITLHVEALPKHDDSLEAATGNMRILLPDQETVLEADIFLFPGKTPMAYGVRMFTPAEWIRTGIIPFDYTFNENPLDVVVIKEIAALIPDPEKVIRKGFGILRRKQTPHTLKSLNGLVTIQPSFEVIKGTW